jgi:predicted Zn-dependent protease
MLLESAQALARDNPGDPLAAISLGEVALRARDAEAAARALETVVAASPEDAEGHHLLGRARRLGGDAAGARQSFERAVALRSEHVEARLALAQLLLDAGEFAQAEAMYTELLRTSGASDGMPVSLLGRLGRVEALLGLGRLDDARVQLEGVREDDRGLQAVSLTSAKLALAERRFGDAITAIRALAEREGAPAAVLALYGEALAGADERDAAAQAFERALARDAGLPEALIGRAELDVRRERGRDALAATIAARPNALLARSRMSLREAGDGRSASPPGGERAPGRAVGDVVLARRGAHGRERGASPRSLRALPRLRGHRRVARGAGAPRRRTLISGVRGGAKPASRSDAIRSRP